VNVQGDEPLWIHIAIDVPVNSLVEEPQARCSTVATPIKTPGTSWTRMGEGGVDFTGNANLFSSRRRASWCGTRKQIQVAASETSWATRFSTRSALEYPTLPQVSSKESSSSSNCAGWRMDGDPRGGSGT